MGIASMLDASKRRRAAKRVAKANPRQIAAIRYLYQKFQAIGGWPSGFDGFVERNKAGCLTDYDREIIAGYQAIGWRTSVTEMIQQFAALRPANR